MTLNDRFSIRSLFVRRALDLQDQQLLSVALRVALHLNNVGSDCALTSMNVYSSVKIILFFIKFESKKKSLIRVVHLHQVDCMFLAV